MKRHFSNFFHQFQVELPTKIPKTISQLIFSLEIKNKLHDQNRVYIEHINYQLIFPYMVSLDRSLHYYFFRSIPKDDTKYKMSIEQPEEQEIYPLKKTNLDLSYFIIGMFRWIK